MSSREVLAKAWASAFRSGAWTRPVLLARGLRTTSEVTNSLRTLVDQVLATFHARPPHDALERFIFDALAAKEHWRRLGPEGRVQRGRLPRVEQWFPDVEQMSPPTLPVPVLSTTAELASWLGLDDGLLDWLADRRGLIRNGPLEQRHYRCVWTARDGRLPRLLEAPGQRLKAAQRKLLREVLEVIPVSDAAHGFVRGRSVLTHAAVHQGQGVVVRVDLRDFFTSVRTARVLGVFRALGYPEQVARSMLALCTTRTPEDELTHAPIPPALLNEGFHFKRRLAEWHLPQGAPTSPALSNLVCRRLDARLTTAAESMGAVYSRYADDLTFSGPKLSPARLLPFIAGVCRDEGFTVNPQKTRVMRSSARQFVTGLVVNDGANLSRETYDQLKARVHAVVTGRVQLDDTQLATLRAELGWLVKVRPAKGQRLLDAFMQRA